jgi:hypothetical protein
VRFTIPADRLEIYADDRGGLYNRHGSGHEQFVWDIRAEPALIDVFAQIWGTDELVVSFGMSCAARSTRGESWINSDPQTE